MKRKLAALAMMVLTTGVLGGALGFGFSYVPNGLAYSIPLATLLGVFFGWLFATHY